MQTVLRKIKNVIRIIDKITDQGDFGYDFVYDAAQKLLFLFTVWILFSIPWGDYRFAIFIFCCIVGRIIVMPFLQAGIEILQSILGAKEIKRPFLWIPRPFWKVGVLIVLTYILIEQMIDGNFFAIPSALIMYFVGFFVFAGYTTLGAAKGSDDPNKKGSPAWKKANGVEQVGFDLMNPLWRDKNGNYYKGTNYVPITPPVNVVNKNK